VKPFKVGDKVFDPQPVEAFPHFLAPPGLGSVVAVGDPTRGEVEVCVKRDDRIEGAGEWDNEIHYCTAAPDGYLAAPGSLEGLVNLSAIAVEIAAEVRRDFPQAKTWLEVHRYCDANDIITAHLGEIPYPGTDEQGFDAWLRAANWTMGRVDALLRKEREGGHMDRGSRVNMTEFGDAWERHGIACEICGKIIPPDKL